MEDDLILGEGEEVEEIIEEVGYTYPEYISASVEVLTMLETANPMTREEVEKMQEIKHMCLEMLEYSVKNMHKMLFTTDT
jgi:spermidine synthase